MHNEKKAILNIPVNFDVGKGSSKDGQPKGFDTELVVDALERMRDYISAEHKKMKDEFVKLQLDIETKIREKLDKKDIEDIESNFL